MAQQNKTTPLLPLRGVVVFPGSITNLDIGRSKSIKAIESAMLNKQQIFLSAQKDTKEENPAPDDVFLNGTLADIKQMVTLPGGNIRIVIEGISRGKVLRFVDTTPYLTVEVVELFEIVDASEETEALVRTISFQFDRWGKLTRKLSPEVIANIVQISDARRLTDVIAAHVPFSFEDKQELLALAVVQERLLLIAEKLAREVELAELENKIQARVRTQIDKNQKEYYLREQIKAIQKELDEKEGNAAEADELRKRMESKAFPDEVAEKIAKELDRFEKMPAMMPESAVVRSYLDWLIDLPWFTETADSLNIENARTVLDEDHYGLEKIKERIIEYLAVKQLNGNTKGSILCFIGPPGVGKTSLAKSIARALDKKFARISLGGVRDEAEIRGHRRTYVSALPGRIINAVKKAGVRNPVFLLDEIDKMSSDFKGDPASAMLEVLDPEQNNTFTDHYLEVPFDLSKIFWVVTANNYENIPRPLLDRMEIINLSGYTMQEKLQIAKKFLLPKQRVENGLDKLSINISDEAISKIIIEYTRESGVRGLERRIAELFRKIAVKKLSDAATDNISVATTDIRSYLGKTRYLDRRQSCQDQVGVATGLAWTEVGGDVLPVEVSVMQGKGALTLTGQLGDVMQESAKAGLSYIRTRAIDLGIEPNFYEKDDIHIHCPEGAIPKDGPSAGITMAAAMASALTGRYLRSDVAMTGEITLRGRVLPVGGIKEKVLAAHHMGIRTIILPRENDKDLEDIPEDVRSEMEFVLVDSMDNVLSTAFCTGNA